VPPLRRSPAISHAEKVDPLAPVTVAVPTNTCAVMTRRALGRQGGVDVGIGIGIGVGVGVDVVTVNRLAELIAGPAVAGADSRRCPPR